jgi:beta-ureidopropionase
VGRSITIATTSMATLEDYAPPHNLRHPDPAENLELGLALLDAAGAQKPDLVVLPETFVAAGLPSRAIRSVAEPIPGPLFDALASRAKRYATNVVAGFFTLEGERVSNVAALINRSGQLIGLYSKAHPTEGEIEGGVTPGVGARVFDTDIGRIGMAICFDVNWPSLWSDMKRDGAELVCWISAYEGGLPLQAQASLLETPIVTSVWPYHARIIDKTGRILAQTSRWSRLAVHRLDLDKRVFHTDQQAHLLLPIQKRYGDRVLVESFTEEHIFTISSFSSDLAVDDVIREFGLVEFQAYVGRCERRQASARAEATGAASPELAGA